MAPYHGVHPSPRSKLLQHGSPTGGRQLPPDPLLLLRGLLSTGCSSGPGPAPAAGALHGPQPPPGHIHPLQRGLLHGGAAAWRSAPCGTHRLQWDSLLHQGPLHRPQGNCCCEPGAPPASCCTHLGGCREVSHSSLTQTLLCSRLLSLS